MNDNIRWVKVPKDIFKWEWWDDRNTRDLYFTLLLLANEEEIKWKGIVIPFGGLVASVQELSIKSGLSVQEVRTSLSKLELSKEITKKATNKYHIITICNYNNYVASNASVQQTGNKQSTNEQQTKSYDVSNNAVVVSHQKRDFFCDGLVAVGVEQNVAEDWIKVRKNKKLTQTETALKKITANIQHIKDMLGCSANDVIKTCVERSWGGCEPDFFRNIQPVLFEQNDAYEAKSKYDANGNPIKERRPQ